MITTPGFYTRPSRMSHAHSLQRYCLRRPQQDDLLISRCKNGAKNRTQRAGLSIPLQGIPSAVCPRLTVLSLWWKFQYTLSLFCERKSLPATIYSAYKLQVCSLNFCVSCRGHDLKLYTNYCHVNVRKHFCSHIIAVWNALKMNPCNTKTLKAFKIFLKNVDLSEYLHVFRK